MPSLMKHSAFGRTCAALTSAKPLVHPTSRAMPSIETASEYRKWPAAPGDDQPYSIPTVFLPVPLIGDLPHPDLSRPDTIGAQVVDRPLRLRSGCA